MSRFKNLISKYVIQAILPYLLFTWILLSVVLFVQQAGRYSDIFFNANLPTSLIWQLTLALVPSVIAFTCPMAILVGAIIGLSRMQGDNELTIIRASGIGNFQILLPVLLLGLTLSFFAFLINWKGVPIAAQMVRRVALQTALLKLESPIEPGIFNTEIWGYTIYVKSGNIKSGTWEKIFIFNEDKLTGQARLITSNDGKVDTDNDDTELVLGEALVSSFSLTDLNKPVTYDRVKNLRFVVQTKRGELIERLSKTEETPEEMGLSELSDYAQKKDGKERTEAQILWQRRIILSITPLLFAALGASLVLRFNRGGRGFGIFLALVSLIFYYLLALMGEQLARTGQISVSSGGLIPVLVTIVLIVWLNLSHKTISLGRWKFFSHLKVTFLAGLKFNSRRGSLPGFVSGILDFDIILNLLKFFALATGFLVSIYLIFTAFELWRYAANLDNGVSLLTRYLLYMLPFVYLQIAPSCLMVATLATFVIKSRQNEIVTWTAAGQSVYRLLLPCFLLMAIVGLCNWQIQERVLPQTNRIQDELREQMRNRTFVPNVRDGRFWTVAGKRIYAFDLKGSDFERQNANKFYAFEFSENGESLKSFIKSEQASWKNDKIELLGEAQKNVWLDNGKVQRETALDASERFLDEPVNPFGRIYTKPNHLTSAETEQRIQMTDSESEKRLYGVALERKYSTLVLPFIITLLTAPFALSLSRKGKVATVGYAVGVWLVFMASMNTFEQLGLNGYISPQIAVWSPLLLFTIIGCFLLTKIKT